MRGSPASSERSPTGREQAKDARREAEDRSFVNGTWIWVRKLFPGLAGINEDGGISAVHGGGERGSARRCKQV